MVKRESNKYMAIPDKKDIFGEIIDESFNRHQQTKNDI